jgi:uncharacterized membrane protein/predicted amidophosphoribosyltransferase
MENIICAGCEAEVDVDALFCNECGMLQEKTATSMDSANKTCPRCKKEAAADTKFCSDCAYDFSIVVEEIGSPTCPGCANFYTADDKFCRHCAFDLSQISKASSAHFCTSCGKSFELSDKFCRHCAYDLSKSNQTVAVPTISKSVSESFNTPQTVPAMPVEMPSLFSSLAEPQTLPGGAETAAKPGALQWVSPSAALFALICFFMPWIEVSCNAFGSKLGGKAASGADLAQVDGSLWLLPLLAGGILIIFFIFKSQGKTANARPFIAIGAGLALVFLIFKALNLESSTRGMPGMSLGSEWKSGLDFEARFGIFGVILGFVTALIGIIFLGASTGVSRLHEISSPQIKSPNKFAVAVYGLAFILSWIWLPVPIFFLLKEPYKTNAFIRFHSFQSILLIVITVLAGFIVQILAASMASPFSDNSFSKVLILLVWGILIASVIAHFFCMWKAYNNEEFKIPIIGDWAMNLAQKSVIK